MIIEHLRISAKFNAAVELEQARDNLRIAVQAGCVTPADYQRAKTADAVWSQLNRRSAA